MNEVDRVHLQIGRAIRRIRDSLEQAPRGEAHGRCLINGNFVGRKRGAGGGKGVFRVTLNEKW